MLPIKDKVAHNGLVVAICNAIGHFFNKIKPSMLKHLANYVFSFLNFLKILPIILIPSLVVTLLLF